MMEFVLCFFLASRYRDMEPALRVSVLSRPLSSSSLGGLSSPSSFRGMPSPNASSLNMSSSDSRDRTLERDRDAPLGSLSPVAAAIATAYSPSSSSAPSSYSPIRVEGVSSGSREGGGGEDRVVDRGGGVIGVCRGHGDSSGDEGDGDGEGVAIVVAEQWVSCVHCAADNPPSSSRCEVCYGPLTNRTPNTH